jgi:hypothetical protein
MAARPLLSRRGPSGPDIDILMQTGATVRIRIASKAAGGAEWRSSGCTATMKRRFITVVEDVETVAFRPL